MDFKPAQQLVGVPRILGQNRIGLSQRLQGPGADIAQMADRRADDIESGFQFFGFFAHQNSYLPYAST